MADDPKVTPLEQDEHDRLLSIVNEANEPDD